MSELDPNLFSSLVAMNALFASLAWCLARPNWVSMVSLAAFGALWLFVNKPLEGHTLVVLNADDGITESDLLSVFAAVVLIIQAGRLTVRARKHRDTEPH